MVDAIRVREAIETAFWREGMRGGSGIAVKVEGGDVTIEGKVSSWRESEIAEEAAWCVYGVSQVMNRLRVTESLLN